MNKVRKIRVGGTARIVATFLVALLLFSSIFVPANAIDVGHTISYNSYHVGSDGSGEHSTAFNGTIDGKTFGGACADASTPAADSGTGTVKNEITDAKLRAVLYHILYEEKMWEEPLKSQSLTTYLDLPHQSNWKVAVLPMAVTQMYGAGSAEAWINQWGSSVRATEYIARWYENYNYSNIDVPDNFKLYYVDCGSDQNFIMWLFEDTQGKLKLRKVSANTDITG